MATKKNNPERDRVTTAAGWVATICGIVGLGLGYAAIWAPGDLSEKLGATAILTAFLFLLFLSIYALGDE